jgi:hypothetical protein
MVRSSKRIITVALAAFALCAAVLGMSSTAFAAAPGSDIQYASELTLGSTIATTLAGNNAYPGDPTGVYYTRTWLDAGTTVRFDITPGVGVTNLDSMVLSLLPGDAFITGNRLADNSWRISFMASRKGMYNIQTTASSIGTFTISATKVAAVNYTMSNFTMPSKAKKKKSFALSVRLNPDYNGQLTPVSFYIERYVGRGKWKSAGAATSHFDISTATYTRYSGSAKLSSKGTYRIRAKFKDAAHTKVTKATYTAYKKIVVK